MVQPRNNWCRLLTQAVRLARSLEAASAGSSKPTKRAMTAMTTKSSINVNPPAAAGRDVCKFQLIFMFTKTVLRLPRSKASSAPFGGARGWQVSELLPWPHSSKMSTCFDQGVYIETAGPAHSNSTLENRRNQLFPLRSRPARGTNSMRLEARNAGRIVKKVVMDDSAH